MKTQFFWVTKVLNMKKIILFSVLTLVACSNSGNAETFSIRECNEIANEINSTMSNMHVDSITILKNAICHRPSKLNYMYQMTVSATEDEVNFVGMRRKNIQTWCTDPDMRFLLERLSGVAYTYRDKNGIYIGEYGFKKSDCG